MYAYVPAVSMTTCLTVIIQDSEQTRLVNIITKADERTKTFRLLDADSRKSYKTNCETRQLIK